MDSEDTVRWSNLPKDLLIMVAKRLDTRTEILRLRAVCSSWRSSLPRSLTTTTNNNNNKNSNSSLFTVKFPFPIAPNPALNPKRLGFFTLTERTIYYLEPFGSQNPNFPKGWMVKVEAANAKPGKMRILDTLSKYSMSGPLNGSPKVLNLLNFRVSELWKFCNLQFVGTRNDLRTDLNELKSIIVKKVVMDDSNGDCAILTIHTGGKLGYFKLGDKKWTMIDDGGQVNSHYDDILHRNGKFYAVDTKGVMIVIDSSLNFRVIESPVPCYGYQYGGHYKFLVESNKDLFLVDKYLDWDQELFHKEDGVEDLYLCQGNYDCMIHFKIYKLNVEEREWVQVTSLGDRAIFIGDDCCFSVSAGHFPGCKGNCIYYTDLDFTEEADDHPGYNVGMFDLESYTSGPLSYFKGYSGIFWPPPTWLKPNVSSKLKIIY